VLRFFKSVCVCCLGVVHAPVQSTCRTLPPFHVHRSSHHGCGVVVGFIAIGVGWWWVFTTPSHARRSAGAGDVAQQRCIVEVVGSGSYGRRPSLPWVWGGDEPSLPLVLGQQ